MTTTAEHIAAIRKALEAAPSAGPWHEGHLGQAGKCQCRSIVNEDYAGGIATVHLDNRKPISDGGNDCPPIGEAVANMALIASCNPVAMTAVLAELDRLKAENERMREALEFYDCHGPLLCDCKEGNEDKDNVCCGFRARAALKGDTHGN